MQHAFHPRYKSRLTLSDTGKKLSNKTSARVKRLEYQVRAVMADPRLDEEQKYRTTKRHFAKIDFHTAFKDFIAHQKALVDLEARDDYHKKVMRGLLQEYLDLEGKVSTTLWQFSKLHVFARWGEVGMFYRVRPFVGVLIWNGVLLPLNRLCIWASC
jgi:hypothetical protein